MYLTRTNNSLYILCDSVQSVDIYGGWTHFDRQTGKEGGAGSVVNTSSDTTPLKIIDPPAFDQISVIRFMSARAKTSNSSSVFVRFQVYDSTAVVYRDLFSASLAPGDGIQYQEGRGFFVTPASGNPPTTADLVQQFIDALTNQSPNLPT